MHALPFECNKCDFTTMQREDLNTHLKESHSQSRTFTSTNRSSRFNKTTEENQTFTNQEANMPNPISAQNYNCPKKCAALRKSFDHKDELDLHMMYYHEESQQ